MSSSDAILAYGYNLGDSGSWDIHELEDDYDKLVTLAWYDEDSDDDLEDQAMRHLLNASGFTETSATRRDDDYWTREQEAMQRIGVQFDTYCNHVEPMQVIAAHIITVNRGSTLLIEPDRLATGPQRHDWDTKLAAALATLAITPKQPAPAWILCSYGD
ncbi:hypothetical protein ACIBKY_03560 [Nonomuraea sp. NPDC050394]|uniref:hypothetical protein n=1 Tax=Nonomuraea sp. NPDC050394 TaxID=3364363 RepID=UPI00379ABCDC